MTQGRCGSLLLHRGGLSPPTSCRSPGALELRKMVPLRQIEAAELMAAMNNYTLPYAKSLVAATPQAQLADASKPKRIKGLTEDQVALMERESHNLEREFKIAEKDYGTDHL